MGRHGGARFLVLWHIGFAGYELLRTAIAIDCDLAPWLNDGVASGEKGYHVLCSKSASSLTLYPEGALPGTSGASGPIDLTLGADLSFRKLISSSLKFSSKIQYTSNDGKTVSWRKQPWLVFLAESAVDVIELQPGTEAKIIAERHRRAPDSAFALLVLESGVWRWPTIRIGYEREVLPNAVLRTMARQPGLFELVLTDTNSTSSQSEDALSLDLLSDVIRVAEPRLVKSQTEGKVIESMRSSDQTFLDYNSHPKLQVLHRLTSKLLHVPKSHLHEFQVLRYQKGQHYDSHRDYWDPREFPDVQRFTGAEGYWSQRHATLLWYLQRPEAGGETWFPRAHGGDIPWNAWTACDERGVKVTPMVATAVLFYNLQSDGNIDEFSWHCGCPVKQGTKWAANSWVANSPNRPREWLINARRQKKRKADEEL